MSADPFIPSTKICATCIHLLGKRTNIDDTDKWRCLHADNISGYDQNLVTGAVSKIFNEENIHRYRTLFCCGNAYEEYIPPSQQASLNTLTNSSLAKATGATPILDKLKRLKINTDDI